MDQPTGTRRIERSTGDRWVAGVCGGLAEHFGQPAWVFRLLFVAATVAGGAGIVAYALMWLFLPLAPESGGRPPTGRAAGGWDLSGLLGFISLGLGALLALNALGVPVRVSLWAPLILIGGGVVVLWRQGDEAQRALPPPGPDVEVGHRPITDGGIWVRVLVGLALLVLGVVLFVGPRITLASAAQALGATGAVLAGVVVITLPWVSAWSKRRQAERYAAVRNEERAAMAARVHDSVLQTLTLIQRRADDPREVARLARAEERALRSWLYAPVAASGTLGAALAEVVTTTEADYDARIDLVTVGDAVVDDRVAALIAATREAVLNAAKHADAPASVYAEVTDGEVEVNVKDRGRGFDPEAIPEDRHGVRESIVARMESAGGRAAVRSVPGEGTEVRLLLPREADRG